MTSDVNYDVSPMKKRRHGVKSCSSVSESVPASSTEDNSLVRMICFLIYFLIIFACDVEPTAETFMQPCPQWRHL